MVTGDSNMLKELNSMRNQIFLKEMEMMKILEKLSNNLSSLILLTYHVDVMSKVRQK